MLVIENSLSMQNRYRNHQHCSQHANMKQLIDRTGWMFYCQYALSLALGCSLALTIQDGRCIASVVSIHHASLPLAYTIPLSIQDG
jgi:hypothetical protein